MTKYLVLGNTASYGTLHGMYTAEVIGCEDEEVARTIAEDLGYEAVENWIDENEFRAEAEYFVEDPDDDEAIEEYVRDCMEGEVDSSVYKIIDEYQNMTEEELNEILNVELGVDTFIERYCGAS